MRYLLPILFLILLVSLTKPAVAAENTVTATVPYTTATLSGFAPPAAIITIKEDGVIAATTTANSDGTFSKSLISNEGTHSYTIYYTDTSGLTSPEMVFNGIVLSNHLDTPITGIHLPPTISLSRTSIIKGESTIVSGQAAPGSTLNLFLNGTRVYNAPVASNGKWQFILKESYKLGSNELYANLSRVGLTDSPNSAKLNLKVIECPTENPNCLVPEDPITPTEPESPNPGTKITRTNTYNINLDFGFGSGLNFLLISFLSFIIFLLLIIILGLLLFFYFKEKRRKERELLEELELKVERDLSRTNPIAEIRADFKETENKL